MIWNLFNRCIGCSSSILISFILLFMLSGSSVYGIIDFWSVYFIFLIYYCDFFIEWGCYLVWYYGLNNVL